MSDFTENLRKKLLYRSLNRGCRETDILLGKFATSEIRAMKDAELAIYEQFLDEYDGDIYKWLTGQKEMPPEYVGNIGTKLLQFKYN
jgi:antitoxin CptB